MKNFSIRDFTFKNIVTNPFFVYALTFFFALVFYFMKWVDYPHLSPKLILFLVVTILLSLVLGRFQSGSLKVKHFSLDKKKIWRLSVGIVILISLCIITTLIYAGKVPLFEILFSKENYDYQSDFHPIKFLTLLTTSLNSASITLFVFFYWQLKQKKYLFLLSVGLLIVLLFGSRGLAMVSLMPAILISLCYINKKKYLLLVILLAVFSAYLFGVYGDLRNGAKTRTEYSLYNDIHTDNYPSWMPEEFMWFYYYYTSPIAKFEYVISDEKIEDLSDDYQTMFFAEILPYSISSRLYPKYEERVRVSDFGLASYFVGTAFDDLYLYGKWKGVYLYAVFFFFSIFIILKFIGRYLNDFYLPLCGILSTIALFSVFDNMLSFSPIIFHFFWVLALGGFVSNNMKEKI